MKELENIFKFWRTLCVNYTTVHSDDSYLFTVSPAIGLLRYKCIIIRSPVALYAQANILWHKTTKIYKNNRLTATTTVTVHNNYFINVATRGSKKVKIVLSKSFARQNSKLIRQFQQILPAGITRQCWLPPNRGRIGLLSLMMHVL